MGQIESCKLDILEFRQIFQHQTGMESKWFDFMYLDICED